MASPFFAAKTPAIMEQPRKGEHMWNAICRWFAMHYLPADNETKLAEALFELKHG